MYEPDENNDEVLKVQPPKLDFEKLKIKLFWHNLLV